MSWKLVFAKIISLSSRIWYTISKTISLLRHMSTSATLITFRFKSFNCRTMRKILIHIKYVKNANYLGIVRNSKSTRNNIPVHIKYSSWKSYLQLILNIKMQFFLSWKASCRRVTFYDFFKDTNTCNIHFL